MEALKFQKKKIHVSFRNNWNKSIHRWYRFHAGCSFEFPECMIEYLNIEKGSVILDPFIGSGTNLVTAKEKGIDSIGFDINDFYVFISKVKTYWDFDLINLDSEIQNLIANVKCKYHIKSNLLDDDSFSKIDNIPSYIFRYFTPTVLEKISLLKKEISTIQDERIKDFMFLALASMLIDVSKVRHVGETIVFRKNNKNAPKVLQIFLKKIDEMLLDLKIMKSQVKEPGRVNVEKADVRDLEYILDDESIDNVITHPPYANNYNYLLHDRLPLFFLYYLYTREDEKKLNQVLAGSARKMIFQDRFEPPIKEVEVIANKIKNNGDSTRYHSLLEYFDTMNKFLEIFTFKTKPGGYLTMLVGNSYIRGEMIPLDQLLGKMAKNVGYDVIEITKVRDRGNGAFQHIYDGQLYESIVVLKNT